jgi:phospholipid transport system transporter-binding protein
METILYLKGELSFNTVQQNLKVFRTEFDKKETSDLVLDLKEVKQCDSAGLALLIEARRASKRLNKQLKITNASKELYALAEFCGVEDVIND